MTGVTQQITALVADARLGDAGATAKLVPLVYAELRHIAASLMARERDAATLQPTALVHEAYLRLLGNAEWQSRAHFLGAAAQAMRRILIEHARKRHRLKRGGGELERVTLTDGQLQYDANPEQLLALEQALVKLEARDREMARVVELRYFGGLTVEETAEVLGSSPRTVHRQWAGARAWLHRELAGSPPPEPEPEEEEGPRG